MKPKAINPKETTRSEAFELWMSAPNPMVTFFKQINVTNLVRISKKYKLIREQSASGQRKKQLTIS